jgi:phosphoadenosine phosphosulfate reductase
MSPQLQTQVLEAKQRISGWNQRFSSLVFGHSMGAEDIVLADLLAKYSVQTRWFTLQTGRLNVQTVQLIERVEHHFDKPVARFVPEHDAIVVFQKQHGNFPMYESVELRQQCCQIRKLQPLQAALRGSQAWFTGLRRDQSQHRQDVAFEELEASGRYKLSPLAQWTSDDVWQYIKHHHLPYNPLHDQGYPSIGCEPCTRAIRAGEPERAGRWWWEQGQKECGLHVKKEVTQVKETQ